MTERTREVVVSIAVVLILLGALVVWAIQLDEVRQALRMP